MNALDQTRVVPAPPAVVWSSTRVRQRLVEAFRILKRLPDPHRVRRVSNGWPATPVHEFADVVFWEDASARVWESWGRPSSASSAEVSRMEQALSWLEWLPEGERRCLQVWAHCSTARRMKLRRVIHSRFQCSPQTFYKKCTLGANRIAAKLNHEGIPVR